MQTVAWWDKTFRKVPAQRCAEAGADRPLGTGHAWQLPGGFACVDQGPDAWGGHIITVDVFFLEPTTEKAALSASAAFLPPDARRSATVDGANPEWSAKPEGSCRLVVYTSPMLRTAATSILPTWPGNPAKVTAWLYSGKRSSEIGAEEPYDPRRVHLSSLLIGDQGHPADGKFAC